MEKPKELFSVCCYSMIDAEKSHEWVHWADNLKMVITKENVTINLEQEEIEQLVKSLPRTIGGSY